MNLGSFNHRYGLKVSTDVPGLSMPLGLIANLNWPALQTVAADTDGIHAARACPAINVASTAVIKAASAVTDTLTTTIPAAEGAFGNEIKIILTTAADDVLAVTKTDETKAINIALANSTAAKNAAALIQTAIRALTSLGSVSLTAVTCAAGGNWDTAAIATGETGSVYFAGGLSPVDSISTGFTNPPCARNVTATAGGTAGDIKAIRVTVYGKRNGELIEEQLPAFTVNTAGTVSGNLAFDEVTLVDIPAHDGLGATTAIGFGELIGLPYKLSAKRVLLTLNDGVVDTAPALAISSTVLAANTVDFNGSLDGSVMDMSMIV